MRTLMGNCWLWNYLRGLLGLDDGFDGLIADGRAHHWYWLGGARRLGLHHLDELRLTYKHHNILFICFQIIPLFTYVGLKQENTTAVCSLYINNLILYIIHYTNYTMLTDVTMVINLMFVEYKSCKIKLFICIPAALNSCLHIFLYYRGSV